MLTLFSNCLICETNRATSFAITGTKLFAPVVTLWTQDNIKLLKQLKIEFKWKIFGNKFLSKVSTQTENQHLDYFIDPSFQGMNRYFILSFGANAEQREHTESFLPKKNTIDYHNVIDGRNFFDQPIRNGIKTHENIRKIATG